MQGNILNELDDELRVGFVDLV